MFEQIRSLNPSDQELSIVDCRSRLSAHANKAKSGGTESLSYYKNCKIDFKGIDNIHVMRESLRAVQHNASGNGIRRCDLSWLQHVQTVLKAAQEIASMMENDRTSVLIHCSDGWDRTAQLSSLVQLFLDPYYRTITGFQVLIEKEWVGEE